MSGLEIVGVLALIVLAGLIIVGAVVLIRQVDENTESIKNQTQLYKILDERQDRQYWELKHKIDGDRPEKGQ